MRNKLLLVSSIPLLVFAALAWLSRAQTLDPLTFYTNRTENSPPLEKARVTMSESRVPISPDFSPNVSQGKIVFLSGRDAPYYTSDQPNDIYIMNADGSNVTKVLRFHDEVYAPALSPDGSKIAFTSDGDIHVVNVDGSNLIDYLTYPSNGGWPSWSPDGTKLAYQSLAGTDTDIFVMNADGTGQLNLTNSSFENDNSPSWSPDGTKIIFSTDKGDTGWHDYDLWLMNADGLDKRQLTFTEDVSEVDAVYSPAGDKIAYVIGVGWNEVMVMNSNGTGQTNLTNYRYHDSHPTWSPDGTKIAFDSYRLLDGKYRISVYTMNANGSGLTNLTPHSSLNLEPTWSQEPPPPPTYSLFGHVSDDGGNPIFGVRVTINGPVERFTTTSSSGYYEFDSLPPGSYSVTPSLDQHVFTPPVTTVIIPRQAVPISFIATPASITFSLPTFPTNQLYEYEDNQVLSLHVMLDNEPAQAFVYRIQDGEEIELGHTDNDGVLRTTLDKGQTVLLGHYSPMFRAVLANGTHIEASFPYNVETVTSLNWVLDEAGKRLVSSLVDTTDTVDIDDLILHIHTPPAVEAGKLLVDILQDMLAYHPEIGDHVSTFIYWYRPDDQSIPSINRTEETIIRNGQVLKSVTAWSNNVYYVAKGWVQVSIASPAHLYLTDPEGRHTGVDPVSGQLVNEIPFTYYTGPNTDPETIIVFRPIPGTYRTQAIGYDSGMIHLGTWSLSPLGRVNEMFATESVVSGQIIEQVVSYSDVSKAYLPTIVRK